MAEYIIVIIPDDMAASPYECRGHDQSTIVADHEAWDRGEVYEYYIERTDLVTGDGDDKWATGVAFYSLEAAKSHALNAVFAAQSAATVSIITLV